MKQNLKKNLKKKLKTKLKRKINTKSRFIQHGGINNKTTNLLELPESPESPESLVISYSSTDKNSKQVFININNININNNNNIDLTGKAEYYINEPNIFIINAKPKKLYMVTMIDPDAPNGLEVTDKSSNHIYTHWVATINTNTNNNGNIKQILVKYAPPTPPKGTHRYIFNLYDVTQKKDDLNFLNTLKMNNNDTRTSYYNKKILNINNYKLQNQNVFVVKSS